jgi:type IV secretion system protein VirD4
MEVNNYYQVKLFGSLLGPFIIIGTPAFIFREEIAKYEPFPKKESVHGDARWATEQDIKRAGLRAKKGMLMGQDKNGYYVAEGYQHALLFAPTGSGKGVGFVIPNLLFWEDSVIVHDIKLENHELTSGFRSKKLKQKVYTWSPAEPDGWTHCYNPIDWVSSKPGQMVDDVQKIANLIMPEKEFWNNEARSLFVGVVLYLLAVPEKTKSFGEVVRTMRSDDVVYNLAVVLDTIGKQIHPVAYMNIAAFLQKADKERSGVISTLNSSLELWANPLIDTATASSDFNIQNFKKERTTVYVGLTPDNIQRLEPLMQVFYQQATEFLTRKIPKKEEEPYGVLFVMDEFPTLGKMEQFKTGIAYFRGYHVRLFLIIQDTEQLKGIYEEAGMNSFLSNSTYRITFSANNVETANLISQLCGNKTVEQSSQNKPKFFDLNPASRSLHVSEVQRALLLPQEVILLPRDEQIVLIESFPPIKSKKIKYYEDSFFKKRLLPPTPIPQQEPYDPRKLNKPVPATVDTNTPKETTSDENDDLELPKLDDDFFASSTSEGLETHDDTEEKLDFSHLIEDEDEDNKYTKTPTDDDDDDDFDLDSLEDFKWDDFEDSEPKAQIDTDIPKYYEYGESDAEDDHTSEENLDENHGLEDSNASGNEENNNKPPSDKD